MRAGEAEKLQTALTKDKSVLQRCTGDDSCTNAYETVSLNAEKTCTFITTQASHMDTGPSRGQKKYVLSNALLAVLILKC